MSWFSKMFKREPPKRLEVTLKDVRIVCDERPAIERAYRIFSRPKHWGSKQKLLGFRAGKIIYVPWYDKTSDGRHCPNFHTLGHELWHILTDQIDGPEGHGDFH